MTRAPRVLLHDDGLMYELTERGDGSLWLEVVVGTIALYPVVFRLDEGERARFDAEGKPFIDELARRVVAEPKVFSSRASS